MGVNEMTLYDIIKLCACGYHAVINDGRIVNLEPEKEEKEEKQ